MWELTNRSWWEGLQHRAATLCLWSADKYSHGVQVHFMSNTHKQTHSSLTQFLQFSKQLSASFIPCILCEGDRQCDQAFRSQAEWKKIPVFLLLFFCLILVSVEPTSQSELGHNYFVGQIQVSLGYWRTFKEHLKFGVLNACRRKLILFYLWVWKKKKV